MDMNKIEQGKMPAYNGRFGVMAALTPRKRQCKFASLYPAGSSVGAATTPSRWDVVRQRARVLSKKCLVLKIEYSPTIT